VYLLDNNVLSRMEKACRDCSGRLAIAFLITLVVVLPALDAINFDGFIWFASDVGDSNVRIAVIGGIASAITLILIVPVLRRGVSWQQLAACFLTLLPAALLCDVARICFQYWTRTY